MRTSGSKHPPTAEPPDRPASERFPEPDSVHVGHMHVHDVDCGHPRIVHGSHVDYIHDGHRHAGHGTHYDEH